MWELQLGKPLIAEEIIKIIIISSFIALNGLYENIIRIEI